jgi:hypothetical protein
MRINPHDDLTQRVEDGERELAKEWRKGAEMAVDIILKMYGPALRELAKR